ncbi:MAG: N-acetylmuramoyl-L-alanine amidase, partial [Mediterranea sp.]|nr:N-acetylmuramoyl-L-alanine amidase [Mediterranea sp.]
MRTIDLIVVHCSATREGQQLTPEALDLEHRRRGFRG